MSLPHATAAASFTYRDIQGWFNFEDIYQQAVDRIPDSGIFVEVGAWRGTSSGFLAEAIRQSNKDIAFHVVDTWRGSNEEFHQHVVAEVGGDLFPEFWENMGKLGVQDVITPHQMHSVDAARLFADESVDFCYIDGSHDYHSVRNDIRAWLPKIKPHGILAGHDIDRIEVRAAVQDAIAWSQVEEIKSSWRWEKQGTERGVWQRQAPLQNRLPSHLVCIPCVAGPHLLDRAVRSVLASGANVAVFDTSENGLALDSSHDWLEHVSLFKTNQQLTFTQSMNLMQEECRQLDIRWLIFMHSDAACHDKNVLPELLARAEQVNGSQRMGVLFTNYDSFSVFSMEAVNDVGPWDETFEWYCADIDYYHRFRLRGWVVDDAPGLGARVHHDVSGSVREDDKLAHRVSELLGHRHAHLNHKWQGEQKVPYQS